MDQRTFRRRQAAAPLIRKVLVVCKKSARDMKAPAPLRRFLPEARFFIRKEAGRLLQARRSHCRARERVFRVLRRHSLEIYATDRPAPESGRSVDLVISVGGDGTFLEAARAVRRQLILGVNSDPQRSVGTFCAAGPNNFASLLEKILRGRAVVRRLHRLDLALNGKTLGTRLLNEVLVTHRRPAAMSRYWIRVGRRKEEQRSSGLWISTAAGSTGAIRSAGGRKLPLHSRSMQYRPRELYHGKGLDYRLTGGVVAAAREIVVGSLMEEGMICVDGEHRTFPFRYGDVLRLSRSAHPLSLVIG